MGTRVDTRGLLCPLPVIRTAEAIKQLCEGDRLWVIASDPGTLHDIPAWCRVHGHTLVEVQEREHEYEFVIRVHLS